MKKIVMTMALAVAMLTGAQTVKAQDVLTPAQQAEMKAQKEAEKAQKEADKAQKKAEKAQKKKEAEAKKKAEEEKKKAEEARKKAEEEKKKAEAEAKKKAEAEAKKKAEAEAKRKAEEERSRRQAQQAEDDLFKELGDGGSDDVTSGGTAGNAKDRENYLYGQTVKETIGRYWNVDRSMNGKTGILTLKINDNGQITSQSCTGDKRVCDAAIRAVTILGTLPKPPSADCHSIKLKLTPSV